MSSSKKLDLHVKGLCGRCVTVWGLEPHNPPSPLHIRVYTILYLFTLGRGGYWTREKFRGATVHKAGSKIATWLTVSPVHKDEMDRMRRANANRSRTKVVIFLQVRRNLLYPLYIIVQYTTIHIKCPHLERVALLRHFPHAVLMRPIQWERESGIKTEWDLEKLEQNL